MIIVMFFFVSVDGVGEHMFSQIRSIHVGMHDPFFVATGADRCDCVPMALGALQR